MTAALALPYSRPLTVADLDALDIADDGHRYELLDGCLLVSPAPTHHHQIVLGELNDVIRRASPADLRVLFAPVDVVLADDTVLIPDLLVVARSFTLGPRRLSGPPVLVVEVLSPSTTEFDLSVKRERYQRAGVPAYWVVDPGPQRLIVWELDGTGVYQQVADITGDQEVVVDRPFPVTLRPSQWT